MLKNEKETQSFPARTKIFEAAEHYVLQGEVDIVVDGLVLNSHGPGEVFGEMALIVKGPPSAAAVARTDCQTVSVGERRSLFLVQQHPYFALELMRVLADRLRRRSSS